MIFATLSPERSGKARIRILCLLALLLVAVAAAACGESVPDPEDIPGSGPERGEQLFLLNPLGASPGCSTCHAVDSDETLVGPSLRDIARVAEEQTTGLSAEAYLHEALLNPDTHLAAEFNPGAMPRYGELLSDTSIDDLVAYMLTLR